MHRALGSTVLLILMALPTGAADIQLAANGVTDYKIVISYDAFYTAQHPQIGAAFSELARFLKQVTGATVPIISAHERAELLGPRRIILGRNRLSEALNPPIDWNALGDEGYVIRTDGANLIIAGGPQRGTLNGVYAFLHDAVGCRWYTPQVSVIPIKPTLLIPILNVQYVPPFEARRVNLPNEQETLWAVRNHLNYHLSGVPVGEHEHKLAGGFHNTVGWVHTLGHNGLLPYSEFQLHQDYFALIDGERIKTAQPCLTSDGAFELMMANARHRVERDRRYKGANRRRWIASLSQGDFARFCQHNGCTNAAKRFHPDNHFVGACGVLMDFVNRAAVHFEQEFPDMLIDTLAYDWTRDPPPNTTMHKNVVVRYCPHWICYWHAMDDTNCRRNVERGVMNSMLGWLKISPRVWVWYYSLPSGDSLQYPYPDLYLLSTNFKLMRDVGITGIFVQGASYGKGRVNGAMTDLRAYIHARLMWDPDFDVKQGIKEFADAVYGDAGPHIVSYIDMLHDKNIYLMDSLVASYQPKWGISYTTETLPGFHLPISTPLAIKDQNLRQMVDLFDQGERAVADDQQTLKRLKLVRLSLEYAILLNGDENADYYKQASATFRDGIRAAGISMPEGLEGRFR